MRSKDFIDEVRLAQVSTRGGRGPNVEAGCWRRFARRWDDDRMSATKATPAEGTHRKALSHGPLMPS